jgi:MYXO-CTERM domain-containing protein
MRAFACVLLILAPLALAAPARADVPPEPRRPAWNEHPAPEPDPPPEKPIERLAAVAAALALAGFAAARSRRAEARS